MPLLVCRLDLVNTDQLRHYRDAMTEQIAWVDAQLTSQEDLRIPLGELAKLRELFDVARVAIDRQYNTAVIRDLDFHTLPDDRARARYVASLLDGYEDTRPHSHSWQRR
jgi:hypothetical protein